MTFKIIVSRDSDSNFITNKHSIHIDDLTCHELDNIRELLSCIFRKTKCTDTERSQYIFDLSNQRIMEIMSEK